MSKHRTRIAQDQTTTTPGISVQSHLSGPLQVCTLPPFTKEDFASLQTEETLQGKQVNALVDHLRSIFGLWSDKQPLVWEALHPRHSPSRAGWTGHVSDKAGSHEKNTPAG